MHHPWKIVYNYDPWRAFVQGCTMTLMRPEADSSKVAVPAISPDRPSTIKVQNVSFAYGEKPVLNDVSLQLPVGKFTTILGPNGCGKSTLLNLLMGQIAPSSGTIMLLQPNNVEAGGDGMISVSAPRPIASIPPANRARLIALVPQNPTFSFRYSVRQVVLMGRWHFHTQANGKFSLANVMGFESPEDHRIADEAMWMMDVHHLSDRPIDNLSGGERQRAIIARALAQQSPIILLDEPTSGLDLAHELDLIYTIKQLCKEQSRTVCLITHDLNMALEQADYAVLMSDGKVTAEGKPRRILNPENLEPVYGVKVTNMMGRLQFMRRGGEK